MLVTSYLVGYALQRFQACITSLIGKLSEPSQGVEWETSCCRARPNAIARGGGQREKMSPPPPLYSQKNKEKNWVKLLFIQKILHDDTLKCFSFLILPKIVEKLFIRLFDFLPQQKFHFTTSSSEVNCKKGWVWLFQFYHSYAIIIVPTWSWTAG